HARATPDRAGRGDDLLGHEPLRPERRLVIEEDAVRGVNAVGLAVVDHGPVGGCLGDGVGAARSERRLLVGSLARRVAEAFARAGIVEADVAAEEAYRLEQVEAAEADALR